MIYIYKQSLCIFEYIYISASTTRHVIIHFFCESRSQPTMPRPKPTDSLVGFRFGKRLFLLREPNPPIKKTNMWKIRYIFSEKFEEESRYQNINDSNNIIFHHGFHPFFSKQLLSPVSLPLDHFYPCTSSKRPVRHCSICRRHYTRHHHLSQGGKP